MYYVSNLTLMSGRTKIGKNDAVFILLIAFNRVRKCLQGNCGCLRKIKHFKNLWGSHLKNGFEDILKIQRSLHIMGFYNKNHS